MDCNNMRRDSGINEEEFESLEIQAEWAIESDVLTPIRGEIDDIARSPCIYQEDERPTKEVPLFEWTEERLDFLELMVEKHQKKWKEISYEFPGVKIKELKTQWKEKQLSDKKKRKFSPEEDRIILDFYIQNGGNWKLLSTKLVGRTPDVIKNRFYGTIKKKLTPEQKKTISNNKGIHNFRDTCSDETVFFDKFIAEEVQEDISTMDPEEVESVSIHEKEPSKFNREEKRRKMNELYSKMAIIQAFIAKTQSEIAQFKDNQ